MKTSYKITLAYLLLALFLVIQLEIGLLLLLALGLVAIAWAVHLKFYLVRRERMYWGQVREPVAIVDWGLDGPSLQLPDHLSGQFVLCPASEVQEQMAFVKDALRNGQNGLFLKYELPVYTVYFRKGIRCNESPAEYLDHVIETMNQERVKWHQRMDEKVPGWYREVYLEGTSEWECSRLIL